MSVAFSALHQTLKSDQKMINIIYKILNTNDREQYKDNNNNDNAIKYLQPNNDNILDLAEKHYENLVEAFTNNAINASFSSNPIPVELPVTTATSSPCGICIVC
jgi:hypothetical protein